MYKKKEWIEKESSFGSKTNSSLVANHFVDKAAFPVTYANGVDSLFKFRKRDVEAMNTFEKFRAYLFERNTTGLVKKFNFQRCT